VLGVRQKILQFPENGLVYTSPHLDAKKKTTSMNTIYSAFIGNPPLTLLVKRLKTTASPITKMNHFISSMCVFSFNYLMEKRLARAGLAGHPLPCCREVARLLFALLCEPAPRLVFFTLCLLQRQFRSQKIFDITYFVV
jgi:hypothetical protein